MSRFILFDKKIKMSSAAAGALTVKIAKMLIILSYHNNPQYWDRQVQANSVDPGHMPHTAEADLDLHCLPLNQQFKTLQQVVNCSNVRMNMVTY